MSEKDETLSHRRGVAFVKKSMYATGLGKFAIPALSLFFTRDAIFSPYGISKLRPPASPSVYVPPGDIISMVDLIHTVGYCPRFPVYN